LELAIWRGLTIGELEATAMRLPRDSIELLIGFSVILLFAIGLVFYRHL
jgi:hypothetical protein